MPSTLTCESSCFVKPTWFSTSCLGASAITSIRPCSPADSNSLSLEAGKAAPARPPPIAMCRWAGKPSPGGRLQVLQQPKNVLLSGTAEQPVMHRAIDNLGLNTGLAAICNVPEKVNLAGRGLSGINACTGRVMGWYSHPMPPED